MKYIIFNSNGDQLAFHTGSQLSFEFIESQKNQGVNYFLIPEEQENDHNAGWEMNQQGELNYNQGKAQAAQQQENNHQNRGKRRGLYPSNGDLVIATYEAIVNGDNSLLEALKNDVEEIDGDNPVT